MPRPRAYNLAGAWDTRFRGSTAAIACTTAVSPTIGRTSETYSTNGSPHTIEIQTLTAAW